ncbi:hypothetical protein IQ260_30565 [Leptolyngbya cf. ectocarpi LEGE 11479]|uniref:Uncharacterized protein n=1 Tax=Leptolyngbya cf. ectocarpi LEGE 11479 TaxID=1828722 RepID=A0A929A0L7_LEPEC|nr:hypothetical protein [Leptolyngbya ectocarpi]MBE9070984.1 hypothetical protein [Leptolyngbya cf. ectocarpi LEGE 11479]
MNKDSACDRIWLLYLQGRLSPAQLLALCQISAETRANNQPPEPPKTAAA